MELNFKILLGPVEQNEKLINKLENEKDEKIEEDSDSESESEEEEDNEIGDDEDVDVDYSQYDKLIVGSDQEDEEETLDQSIDYNELTDLEPSDDEQDEESDEESEDEFFQKEESKPKDKKEKKEKKEKKDKFELPELTTGYISGDSDSEVEDKLVEEITKPAKKNRRGQRARQKIWEMKYGSKANHVKKEYETKQKIREQNQKDYEERVKRREAKGLVITGNNQTPLGSRGSASGLITSSVDTKQTNIHPSWEAKLKQKKALQNVKFEGKKVTFD